MLSKWSGQPSCIAARISFVLLIGGSISAGLGCAQANDGATSSGSRRDVNLAGYNVVFILADTLRADHLGAWGYARDTSPFLDRYTRSSLQFRRARSQASCTFPSVNSILTSRNTFEFIDPETRPGIPAETPTIADVLSANGYATAAISASPIVRTTPGPFNPKGGFGSGFDTFDESCTWATSDCVTPLAVERLDTLDEPFFLYLHYMDPHGPYRARAEHRGQFAKPYHGPNEFIALGDPNPIEQAVREGRADQLLEEGDIEHLIDLYDQDIASFDTGLNELFSALEAKFSLTKTIVVLVADHGEAFYEHKTIKHCHTVFDEETWVPLIFHLPGETMPAVFDQPVQNLDVVPTLYDYLGIATKDMELEGRTLRPLIAGASDGDDLAFSAYGRFRSVNDHRYKLIFDVGGPGGIENWALYDLEQDPQESTNVLSQNRAVFRRLHDELSTWMDRVEPGASTGSRLDKAREIEEELRKLGYLG